MYSLHEGTVVDESDFCCRRPSAYLFRCRCRCWARRCPRRRLHAEDMSSRCGVHSNAAKRSASARERSLSSNRAAGMGTQTHHTGARAGRHGEAARSALPGNSA